MPLTAANTVARLQTSRLHFTHIWLAKVILIATPTRPLRQPYTSSICPLWLPLPSNLAELAHVNGQVGDIPDSVSSPPSDYETETFVVYHTTLLLLVRRKAAPISLSTLRSTQPNPTDSLTSRSSAGSRKPGYRHLASRRHAIFHQTYPVALVEDTHFDHRVVKETFTAPGLVDVC